MDTIQNDIQAPLKTVKRSSRTVQEIQNWMVEYLSKLLNEERDNVDVQRDFEDWGLDSTAAVGMVGDLEEWLGQELEPTLPYVHPNIEALSEYLAQNQ